MGNIAGNLAGNPAVLRFGAKIALRFLPRLAFGNTAVFSRWEDVQEILRRDLDFLIAPINGERIERVNGPFILGMDRSATHLQERKALYAALRQVDLLRIHALASKEADDLLNAVPVQGTIDVINGYARLVAARSAANLMGIHGPTEADPMRVVRTLFHECFLNLGDDLAVREKAVKAFPELKEWCEKEIAKRRKTDAPGDDMVGRLIASGELDDDGIRRTVSGMMVGAIDTTATCVAQIITVILQKPALLREVMKDLGNPERMSGWCWEALRFWPHNPIVQRQAANDTEIAGKKIKAGTRVICFTLAAMHDPGAFPYPEKADPQRPPENYLHFGGGLHPCAGRAVNGMQIPLLVERLLRRDPAIKEAVSFEGPFPNRLILTFRK